MTHLRDEFDRIRTTFKADAGITFEEYQSLRRVDAEKLMEFPPMMRDRSILNQIHLAGTSANDVKLKTLISEAVSRSIEPIARAIVPITNALCEILVDQNNLYGNTAIGSETKSERQGTFRKNLLKSLGYNPRKRKMFPCMVSGESGDGDIVVAAHIISTRSKIRNLRFIGLTPDDISSSRNGLLLSKNIETAFDALQLSFVRSPVPGESGVPMDGFKVKIWDASCRSTPIYAGSKKLIGEYDGHPLALMDHNPFKRALSYQAYAAFLHFRHELDAEISPPSEYGTDNESKYYKQRKLMKESIDRDIAEEVGDTECAEVDDD